MAPYSNSNYQAITACLFLPWIRLFEMRIFILPGQNPLPKYNSKPITMLCVFRISAKANQNSLSGLWYKTRFASLCYRYNLYNLNYITSQRTITFRYQSVKCLRAVLNLPNQIWVNPCKLKFSILFYSILLISWCCGNLLIRSSSPWHWQTKG